jgi:PAS domain S-box-containing protein
MSTNGDRVSVLAVDDDPRNLLAIESVLRSAEWDVVLADSGAAALRVLLQQDVAVVVLDVRMHGIDGFETAGLMRQRERSKDVPIIFLTANSTEDSQIARAYSIGAVDFIIKPFEPEILRAKVAVFVELFRTAAQVRWHAERLADTTALLDSVLQGATDYAITAIDTDRHFVLWNVGAQRLYGYAAGEVVGHASYELLHTPQDIASGAVASFLAEAGQTGHAQADFEVVRKDGSRLLTMVSLDERLDANGHRIGFVVISRDVTAARESERERARLAREQAARAAAEAGLARLRGILDVLPEAVLIADEHGRIYLGNAAAAEILGRIPTSIDPLPDGTRDVRRLDGSPCPPEEEPLSRAVRRGETTRGEQLILTNPISGASTPILVSAAPLADGAGLPSGGVAVFQDISAIRDLERQKDEFLAAASHDLKTPATIVRGHAILIQSALRRTGRPDPAQLDEGLQAIDEGVGQMVRLVDEMLDVTRLRMGQALELDRGPTDLVKMARRLAAEYERLAPKHRILVLAEEPRIVGDWDEGRIERVVANLISNGVKYSPRGGSIEVSIRREQLDESAWVVLEVRDQGIGIPAEDLEHVFRPYFRGSNIAANIGGTGLGLAGARHIVEQHGGRIEVASVVGKETTLTVRIPVLVDSVEAAALELES